MERTKFGIGWDDAQPIDPKLKQEIRRDLFESLERYFEDCIETGRFLRCVLENDNGCRNVLPVFNEAADSLSVSRAASHPRAQRSLG